MTARTLAVVTAGVSSPSSTRLLADRLAAATQDSLRLKEIEAGVKVVELRNVAHALTDMLLTGFASPELKSAIDAVTGADGVIAVTPVFSASYSGLFKTFFDVLDPEALQDKPVLLGATAGTARHSLALEYAVRPLFAYLKAAVVPTAVFAASEDWGSVDSELGARIERGGAELAQLVAGRAVKQAEPLLAASLPFEQLLAGQ